MFNIRRSNLSKRVSASSLTSGKPDGDKRTVLVPPSMKKLIDDTADLVRADGSRGMYPAGMKNLVEKWVQTHRDTDCLNWDLSESLGDCDFHQAIDDIAHLGPEAWSRRWAMALLCAGLLSMITLEQIRNGEPVAKSIYTLLKQEGKL